ncbi:myo-inositol-1(or 4)-monophosphatase [Loktanella atrilutea]|uniref:Inositol-1-monophosphatase n=1 Tax=Loktanella atrilutea TaxID=366533 RepID=A0A1M4TBI1_LOKAT|nr:inositol monophosphatase [Loktanella atrilutea]SHE41909.1 myo-inositol-1(or 4)-monophosphatase [Loktanella atrilutea]
MDLTHRLTVATQIATRAGALALRYFHDRDTLHVEAKRTLQDMVSEADREVETLIRDALSAAFPDDALLGEEHGISAGTSGLTWVIDPIDGTAPFLAGLPGWCVSIGACDADGPVIGVIVAPVLGETFTAARGVPTRLNGAPVRVAPTLDLTTGLLGIGANDRVAADKVGTMLADLMAAGASWTRYGSGALMLAWVAAGRLVGYLEPRMSAWDCMAAYCLIEQAGGQVLAFPLDDRITLPAPVAGARPGTYDEILRLTRLDDLAYWEV